MVLSFPLPAMRNGCNEQKQFPIPKPILTSGASNLSGGKLGK